MEIGSPSPSQYSPADIDGAPPSMAHTENDSSVALHAPLTRGALGLRDQPSAEPRNNGLGSIFALWTH